MSAAETGVTIVAPTMGQAFFGGGPRSVSFQIKTPNTATSSVVELRHRLFQASSATLAPLGDARPWKRLEAPGGATLLESVVVDIPEVRGETAFQLVWYSGTERVGAVRFRVFPANLLAALTRQVGEGEWIAVFDSAKKLEPLTRHLEATRGTPDVAELTEADAVAESRAALLLVGPAAGTNEPEAILAAVKSRAAAGRATIWVRPEARFPERSAPVYTLAHGNGRVVIAREGLLHGFAESPIAQLNFLWLAELASGRQSLDWPLMPGTSTVGTAMTSP